MFIKTGTRDKVSKTFSSLSCSFAMFSFEFIIPARFCLFPYCFAKEKRRKCYFWSKMKGKIFGGGAVDLARRHFDFRSKSLRGRPAKSEFITKKISIQKTIRFYEK